MATDIAFVVGCMALVGPRGPQRLRVMLLSLAIADDIGAILVIAVGYSETLHYDALAIGMGFIAFIVVFRWIGVRNIGVYVFLGILVWLAFLKSGIHPTIAGVILCLFTPSQNYLHQSLFVWLLHQLPPSILG